MMKTGLVTTKLLVLLFSLLLVACGVESEDSESDGGDDIVTTDPDAGSDPGPDPGPDPDPSVANAARANSYDDAWEADWIAKVKNVLATDVGIAKTAGKVLQVGDSMTFSTAYGLWARKAAGGTLSDTETIVWMYANQVGNVSNGWYLSSSGFTAKNNMPWGDAVIDQVMSDPQTNDAQFVILMMNLPSSDPNDLTLIEQRVAQFIAVGIVPILSTTPPRTAPNYNETRTDPYNAALRALAEQLDLPLIDYSQEILLRRPNGTWENTLIGPDGVHPSGGSNGYGPEDDPYSPGGDPATHTTGDALLNSGYLLRTWLAVQKMKEIKEKAVDP